MRNAGRTHSARLALPLVLAAAALVGGCGANDHAAGVTAASSGPPQARAKASATSASPVTSAAADSHAAAPVIAMPAVGLRGTQVAAHRPSLSDLSDSGGSPFEKLVTTDPAVMELAQSSTTRISMAAGKPAETLKLDPNIEKTGRSLVGAQLGVVEWALLAAVPVCGVTTNSKSMGWTES